MSADHRIERLTGWGRTAPTTATVVGPMSAATVAVFTAVLLGYVKAAHNAKKVFDHVP